jgi:CopG family nickel-responsive transcriptional regulator
MPDLTRVSLSIEQELLEQFDQMIEKHGLGNRSEAMRDLIRKGLKDEYLHTGQIIGTVTLLYDHHKRLLSQKLSNTGHVHHHFIMSSMHIHLNDHFCLETIVLKGDSKTVHELANHMMGLVGVIHGHFAPLPLQPSEH